MELIWPLSPSPSKSTATRVMLAAANVSNRMTLLSALSSWAFWRCFSHLAVKVSKSVMLVPFVGCQNAQGRAGPEGQRGQRVTRVTWRGPPVDDAGRPRQNRTETATTPEGTRTLLERGLNAACPWTGLGTVNTERRG